MAFILIFRAVSLSLSHTHTQTHTLGNGDSYFYNGVLVFPDKCSMVLTKSLIVQLTKPFAEYTKSHLLTQRTG